MKREVSVTSPSGFRLTAKSDGLAEISLNNNGNTFWLPVDMPLKELLNAIRYVKGLKTK